MIGRYNKTEARENPAYSYDYSNSQAEFQGITLAVSSALSVGLLSAVSAKSMSQFGSQLAFGLFGVFPTGDNSVVNTVSNTGIPHTGIVSLSEYTPSAIGSFATNFGGMSLMFNAQGTGFAQTGSWGSVANFVNYSDIQDQMTGFTADAAILADTNRKGIQENNKTTYNVGVPSAA